jgi:hypothetical protein
MRLAMAFSVPLSGFALKADSQLCPPQRIVLTISIVGPEVG